MCTCSHINIIVYLLLKIKWLKRQKSCKYVPTKIIVVQKNKQNKVIIINDIVKFAHLIYLHLI